MRGHVCHPDSNQPLYVSLNSQGIPIVNCQRVKESISGITKETFTDFDAAIMYNQLYSLGAKIGKISDLRLTFDGLAKHWALKLKALGWKVHKWQITQAIRFVSSRKGLN